MKKVRIPAIVLTLLIVCFLIYLAYSAKFLPGRVATHFGAEGVPNGWMSRTGYLIFISVLTVGLPLINIIIVLSINRIPDQFINLPNKDYWLSPENKQRTNSFISGQTLWLACIEVVFFAGLHYLTVESNRLNPVRLETSRFAPLSFCFVAAVILWTIAFVLHFTKRR